MQMIKYWISEKATDAEIETTICHGPFVVQAKDVQAGRELLSLNFTIAVQRQGPLPFAIWEDDGAHEYRILADDILARTIKRTEIFDGVDLAKDYISQPCLSDGEKEIARLIWWPVRDGDICPV